MPGRIIPLSEVKPQQTDWFWQARIPFGAITLVEGRPGSNKSTLLYELAARLSIDKPMPLTNKDELPFRVEDKSPGGTALLFQAEDPAVKVRKQVELAGGSMARVYVHDQSQAKDGSPATSDQVSLPNDLDFVRREIKEKNVRLVVFDPLTSFIQGSINSDRAVRHALDPLKRVAEDTGAAVVLVRHLRKMGPATRCTPVSGASA